MSAARKWSYKVIPVGDGFKWALTTDDIAEKPDNEVPEKPVTVFAGDYKTFLLRRLSELHTNKAIMRETTDIWHELNDSKSPCMCGCKSLPDLQYGACCLYRRASARLEKKAKTQISAEWRALLGATAHAGSKAP